MMQSIQPPPLFLTTVQITLRCDEPMTVPRWKASMLRGGFGRALKRTFCDPACDTVAACPRGGDCPFATMFAPEVDGDQAGTARKGDVPRPYVVRAPLDATTAYRAGDTLDFQLFLAGTAGEYLPHVLAAFRELGRVGLGEGRGRATLTEVQCVEPMSGAILPFMVDDMVLNQPLTLTAAQVFVAGQRLPSTLTLRFFSPARIKHEGQWAGSLECHVVVRAALRRIAQLCAAYGDGPWDVPFADLVSLARRVPAIAGQTEWVEWGRTSAATGQHMQLGGLVGSVTYQDVPPALRAVLLLGSITHVGKAAVFGHGGYRISP